MSKLSSARPLSPHVIAQIEESDIKDRLYEMGIYPDQTIQVVRKAPFGDPLVVKVGGQEIMLRTSEAELITIKEN